MVQLLHTFQKNLGARISWHYSATSHGKGAVDGVGGTTKRTAWSAVSTRKVESGTSAKSFADAEMMLMHLMRKAVLIAMMLMLMMMMSVMVTRIMMMMMMIMTVETPLLTT